MEKGTYKKLTIILSMVCIAALTYISIYCTLFTADEHSFKINGRTYNRCITCGMLFTANIPWIRDYDGNLHQAYLEDFNDGSYTGTFVEYSWMVKLCPLLQLGRNSVEFRDLRRDVWSLKRDSWGR